MLDTLPASHVKRLLIVEDERVDLLSASETARNIGIGTIEARTSSASARSFVEKGLRGEVSLPEAIVLDLDLGHESGHEFLRFWHSTPALSRIPLIVWSRLGDDHKEVCELFKVTSFVSKHEGLHTLREALLALSAPARE